MTQTNPPVTQEPKLQSEEKSGSVTLASSWEQVLDEYRLKLKEQPEENSS